jgi:hypothetical protein
VREFVALAASKQQLAVSQSQRDGRRIHNLAKRHASAVGSVWDAELQEALNHIFLVLHNNKGRGDVVAQRPDIVYAITSAAEAASKVSMDRMDAAWNTGSLLGNAMARRQARMWGLPKPAPFAPDAGLLAALKGDVDNLGTVITAELDKAIRNEDDEAIKKAVSGVVLRSRMAGEASAKYAAQNALGGALEGSGGLYKRWVTTSPVPCSICVALEAHGPILWSAEFPHSFDGLRELKVYGGTLLGPPRHPNCACVLVAVKEK